MMHDELFDVCNDRDEVIGQARRSDVHAQGLVHRAVHVWVWNSADELLVHVRSENKDEFPGCYTSSASGHLDAGEEYEAAAHRELGEELQLRGDLKWMTKLPAGPETAQEHTMLYCLRSDEKPVPDPNEISEIRWVTMEAILAELQEAPQRFSPPFRSLLRWWERHLAGANDSPS